MSKAKQEARTFALYRCEFWGGLGWSLDGNAGETPREALVEAALNGSVGLSYGEACDLPAVFVDANTGEIIREA